MTKTVIVKSCPTAGWVMNNRIPLEEQIKKDMGEDTIVKHRVGLLFHVGVEVDGKKTRECLPAYFCCPSFLSRSMCKKSLENTVSEVKNLCEPTTGEMER